MKRMPKKITLEDLAAMVKHGFDDVYQKMSETSEDTRIEFRKIHKQLIHLEETCRGTRKEVTSHDHRLTLAETRIDHLEAAT